MKFLIEFKILCKTLKVGMPNKGLCCRKSCTKASGAVLRPVESPTTRRKAIIEGPVLGKTLKFDMGHLDDP